MPFTPYHLGPALLVALILYSILDAPAFIIASIILDIEPLVILIQGHNSPLHGTFHSLTMSIPVALVLSFIMYALRNITGSLLEKLNLPQKSNLTKIIYSSILGVWIHVFLDSFLYSDLTLLYPFKWNPMLGLVPANSVYIFCIICSFIAFITYLIRIGLKARKKPLPFLSASMRQSKLKTIQNDKFSVEFEPVPFFDSPEEMEEEIENTNIHEISSSTSKNEVEQSEDVVFKSEDFSDDAEDEDLFDEVVETEEETFVKSDVQPDIFIGSNGNPEQWGLIGRSNGELVAVDLNEPHIVFVCGKQGSGKGYTIGVVSEMLLSRSIKGISQVRKPATTIVFHKPREDMRSEFWSIINSNKNEEEVQKLQKEFNVKPRKLLNKKNFRIFVDPFVYENERKKFEEEYGTKTSPIGINPFRLTAEDWPHVLSIGKRSGSMYVKKIFQIIKKTQYDDDFGIEKIRQLIEISDLNPNQKGFALMRLETLEEYLEAKDFVNDLKLGGVNVFDLRKIMMEPDDIFSVMILVISSILNNEKTEHEQFVFIINEAHDYLRKGLSKDFIDYINYLIRKKRHAGTWLMLDTHFPEDVDNKVIKGSDIKIFHKSDVISSKILKQVVDGTETPPHQLETGQAIIRADQSNRGADLLITVEIRPRITHHGGATKTAV